MIQLRLAFRRSATRGWARGVLAWGLSALTTGVMAFQLGPLGPAMESRLTNEPDSTLALIAGRLGILLKGRVHEEITQLAYDCPVAPRDLAQDAVCAQADQDWATPFIIYGVRWNDLPPFSLSPGQGQCGAFGKSCRVDQTVRFSTQPACWYCLFADAQKIAQTQRIVGCRAGPGEVVGNVMTRSHFGDLQFLHAMASDEGIPASVTQAEVLDWLEFAWKVSARQINGARLLRDVPIATIQQRFGCTGWTVADLYIRGRQDAASGLAPKLHHIAFGSVLHTVQDSFAAGHVEREAGGATEEVCPGSSYPQPPRVIEFHAYGHQDPALHDAADTRAAMTSEHTVEGWPDAVAASRNLAQLHEDLAPWDEVQPYLRCLFELSSQSRASSAGAGFSR